jgi:tetratricopeptide (TPR) repeat protein
VGFPALLLLGYTLLGAPQLADRESLYWEAVSRYANGDRAAALRDIGNFGEKDLDGIAGAIEKLRRAARKCQNCEAEQQFEALPLRIAVLLHAQRDRADRVVGVSQQNGKPDCAASVHGSAVERLLAPLEQQKGGARFVANFAFVMAIDLRASLCPLRAAHWAEVGLKVAPQDPTLFVARGMAAETMGFTGWAESAPFTIYDATRSSRTVMQPGPIDRTRQLNLARESFEKALALEPGQEEARVRLGRVLWRLGRMKEAKEALARAGEGQEKAVRYLAHLFLGRCLQDGEDLKGAIGEYRAALAARPDTQTGAVALAQALTLRGDAEGARQILEKMLADSGNRRSVDPFWTYLIGGPEFGDGLMEVLRLEALK